MNNFQSTATTFTRTHSLPAGLASEYGATGLDVRGHVTGDCEVIGQPSSGYTSESSSFDLGPPPTYEQHQCSARPPTPGLAPRPHPANQGGSPQLRCAGRQPRAVSPWREHRSDVYTAVQQREAQRGAGRQCVSGGRRRGGGSQLQR